MAVGLQVPSSETNNSFSLIITADSPITGVDLNDIRLRPQSTGGAIRLDDTSKVSSAPISQVSGSDNWKIDVNLVATNWDEDFVAVLRANTLTQGGNSVPSAAIFSAAWRVDSSYVPPPSVPANLTATVVDHDTITLGFSASTGTVTQYQYRYATTEAGLSSATWTDGGTGTTITVNGLPASTTLYFQVRAANGTVYSEVSNTANATTQADPGLPTISQIAQPQNFIVGTEFRLTATITNIDTSAGDKVEVKGLLEGYKYGYDNATGVLTIVGTPTALVSGQHFRIIATKSGLSPVIRTVIYNVVPAAPVFGEATAPTVYKGVPYKFFIPIVNMPPKPTAEGLWTGLKFEKGEQGNQEGLIISGTVGEDEFTVDEGEFEVDAPYAGGLVSATFAHTIADKPSPGAVRNLRAFTSGSNFIIDWDHPSFRSLPGVGVFINYYQTEVSSGPPGSGFRPTGNINYPTTRRVITTFTPGTLYNVWVRAYSELLGPGPISRTSHTF